MNELKSYKVMDGDDPRGVIAKIAEDREEGAESLMTWNLLKDSFTQDQFKLLLNGPSLVVPYSFINGEAVWSVTDVIIWLEETMNRIQEASEEFKKLWKMS